MIRLAGLLFLCAACVAPVPAEDEMPPALQHFAAGRYEAAITAARAELTTNPGDVEARRLLGDSLAATGKVEEALEVYEAIPRGGAGPRLDVEMAMARLETVHGNVSAGRDRAQKVLAEHRERGEFLSAREMIAAGDAALLLARGDAALYGSALRIYEQAINQAPNDPAAHVAIADLLLDRYNNEEALDAYRAALQRDAEFVPALRGIAHSHYFERSSGALEAVNRALEIQPTDVGSLVLLARLNLEMERYPEAGDVIDRALAVNPRSAAALTLAAALAFLRGDEQAFDETATRIRQEAPGYQARFYETLAEVAAQNRYYAEAARFAQRAAYLDNTAWHALALFGVNRLRLGDMQVGRQALEAAFRGDPYDVRTRNALELLDRLDGYEQVRSERFVLVADPHEARVLAPRLLPVAERAYDHFSKAYGYSPPTPVRIELYRRHEDFSVRITGLVGVDLMGVSFGPVVALDSPSAGVAGPTNVGSVLWHEIAHTFHLGLTKSHVPRWFSEGLAVFEEHRARPGWGFDVSPGFLAAFLEGRLAPASELNESFLRPRYPDQLVHAYYQGALVMHLIARDHGFEAIVRMLEGYRDGRSTAQMLPSVLGLARQEFDAAFEDYVRQRFGRALEAMTPGPENEDGIASEAPYPKLMREAHRALQEGELDRAFELLTEAQALFPEHAGGDGTYNLLAGLHVRRGETGPAIAQLEQAIAIDANDLEAHQRLAELHLETGDAGDAARVLEQALMIQPFDPALYARVAEIRESRGEWSEAAGARAAIVALEPTDPAGARYELARARHRAGDATAAKREVLEALEIAPMYRNALELLLVLREDLGAAGRPHEEPVPLPDESDRNNAVNPGGKS